MSIHDAQTAGTSGVSGVSDGEGADAIETDGETISHGFDFQALRFRRVKPGFGASVFLPSLSRIQGDQPTTQRKRHGFGAVAGFELREQVAILR